MKTNYCYLLFLLTLLFLRCSKPASQSLSLNYCHYDRAGNVLVDDIYTIEQKIINRDKLTYKFSSTKEHSDIEFSFKKNESGLYLEKDKNNLEDFLSFKKFDTSIVNINTYCRGFDFDYNVLVNMKKYHTKNTILDVYCFYCFQNIYSKNWLLYYSPEIGFIGVIFWRGDYILIDQRKLGGEADSEISLLIDNLKTDSLFFPIGIDNSKKIPKESISRWLK